MPASAIGAYTANGSTVRVSRPSSRPIVAAGRQRYDTAGCSQADRTALYRKRHRDKLRAYRRRYYRKRTDRRKSDEWDRRLLQHGERAGVTALVHAQEGHGRPEGTLSSTGWRGWGLRFVCGAGDVHQEHAGSSKTDAIRLLSARRLRVYDDRGWCPRLERQRQREHARMEQERQARRVTFRAYAEQYVAWAKLHHRGFATEEGRVNAMLATFGDAKLDSLCTADVERFLDGLLATRRVQPQTDIGPRSTRC